MSINRITGGGVCENKEMERISFVILISMLMLASLSIVPVHAAEHPTIIAASVTSATSIVLTYSENVDVNATDGAGFGLSDGGKVTANTDPAGSGNTITLTVSGITNTSDTPDVTYIESDGTVADGASNPAASQIFTGTVDDAPPTVSSIATSSASTIDIVLSENVTVNGAAPGDFVLSGTISTDPTVTGITAAADTVTLSLNDTLDGDDVIRLAYTRTMSSIDDISLTSFVDSFSVKASEDEDPRGLAFSGDGYKIFILDGIADAVHEYTLTAPFDISNAAPVSSFSVASEDEDPRGLAFSGDGTKMFVVGTFDDGDVHEYALAVPFNISDATSANSFSTRSQDSYPRSLAFSGDGTKMFVVDSIGKDVNEYTLTAPFDISNATFVDSFSLVPSNVTFPQGLTFSNDGTRMFVVDSNSNDVHEYALTAPFDVSTATFVDSFSLVPSNIAFPQGLTFSNDGTRMFVTDFDTSDVYEYALSKPFTLFPQPNSLDSFVTTLVTNNIVPPTITAAAVTSLTEIVLTYSENVDVTTTNGEGFTLSVGTVTANTNPAGSDDTITLTVSGITTSDAPVITYIAPPGTVVDAESNPAADQTFTGTTDDAPPTVSSIATAGTSTINIVLSENVTINGAAPEDFALSSTISTDPAVTGITAVTNNTVALALDDTLDSNDAILLAYTKTTGSIDDIPLPPLLSSFPVGIQHSESTGMAFSNDGTRMFVVSTGSGRDNDAIHQYTLTAAFDVSTATFVDSFSVGSQDTVPTGVAFSADGTKMFVVGGFDNNINEYTLTAAFDVSTATSANSFSVASQDTAPLDMAFSADGTKMFVLGGAGDAVYEYTLTAPFDVSNVAGTSDVTFVDSFPVASEDTAPTGLAFSGNGTRMFVVGNFNDAVYEYALTAPFDVSTATSANSFSVSSQDQSPTGLALSADGTRIFVLGDNSENVHQYALSEPFTLFLQPNSLASFAAMSVTNNIASPPAEIDPSIDTTPPTIIAAAVTSLTEILLTYSEDIDVTTTDGTGFALSVGTVHANTDPAGSDDTITLTVSGIAASYTPAISYTTSDGTVTDTASNQAANQVFAGTTPLPDTTPPTITAAAVTSATSIVLTYSENIDVTTTDGEGFALSDGGTVSANSDPASTDDTITLTVSGITASDAPNVIYTESDGSVTDSASNPAANQTFTGTTPLPDTVPPEITAAAVTSAISIVLTYSENIDVSTTNGQGFSLSVGQVTTNTDPAGSADTITLTVSGIPSTSHRPDVTYAASDGTVTDSASNPAASQTFTGTTDDAPPTVSSIETSSTSTNAIDVVLSENVTINGATPEDFALSGTLSTYQRVTGITALADTVTLTLNDTLDSDDVISLAYTKGTGSIDDISLTSFVDSFSTVFQDISPQGLAFSGDGTKMFVAGGDTDTVYEYALAVPFDVSTVRYNGNSFSVASQDTSPQGLAFSNDGTRMFVAGNFGNDVNEYTLTAPFDVSTVTFVDSFSVASQDESPQGLAFSNDGTRMFVAGRVSNAVYEYALTAPFDVSTASYGSSFPVGSQDTSPQGLAFSNDGTRMFVAGDIGNDVNEYTLTSPFDVSTATFVDFFSLATSSASSPQGLAFSNDGTRMFVADFDTFGVHEYALSKPFALFPQPNSLASFAATLVTNNIASPPAEIDPSIDTTPPTITAAAVTSLTEILLTYSENIDVTTTDGTGFALSTGTVHANTDPASTADTITLTVSGIAASDTPAISYTTSDGTVTDTASNQAANQVFAGTTALPDTIPPTITAAAVTSLTEILLTYSENIDVTTTDGEGFTLSDGGTVSANSDPASTDDTITLTVSGITTASDAPNVIYTESDGSVTDTASNPAANQTFTGTTPLPDTVPPEITAAAVTSATSIVLTYSENIDVTTTDGAGFTLSDGQVTANTDPAGSDDTITLAVSGITAFDAPNVIYTESDGSVTDTASNQAEDQTFAGTTAPPDTIPPTITAAAVTSLTEILLTYSENIDVSTTNGAGFALSDEGTVSANTDPAGSGNTIILTVSGITTADTPAITYTAPPGTVVDNASNPAADQTFAGTTPLPDTIPPTITAAAVTSLTEILLTYSENIDVSTTNGAGFALSDGGTVSANTDPAGSGNTIILTVSGITTADTPAITYTAPPGTVVDNASNPAADQTFAGTTPLPDTTPPTITAAAVTSLTEILLTYSENIDVTATNGEGFALSDGGTVSANTDPAGTGNTIILTVSGITTASDAPNVIYTESDGTVTDTASNPAASQTFAGTTPLPDTIPPTITAAAVTSLTEIVLTYSENIDVTATNGQGFALSDEGTVSANTDPDNSGNTIILTVSGITDSIRCSKRDLHRV